MVEPYRRYRDAASRGGIRIGDSGCRGLLDDSGDGNDYGLGREVGGFSFANAGGDPESC